MTNFIINPHPFLTLEMEVEDGGPQRRSRARVHLVGAPILEREDFVLVEDMKGILNPNDYMSHLVSKGKPNANYVRARIRTHVHSDYINNSS
jgi:hypothetical protein